MSPLKFSARAALLVLCLGGCRQSGPLTPAQMVDAAADLAQPSPDLPPDVFDGAPADLSPDLARVANSSPDTAADLAPDLAVDYGPSVCGNGVLEGDEGCDDGNEIDDDACTNDCTLPKCGDGITQPNEDCDDGNSSAEDRCTPECHWVPFKQIVGSVGVWALRTNGMLSSFNDTAVLPTDRFSSIAPNRCGIRLDGAIRCWGYLVNSPSGSFKQMDAGNDFACAVRSDGALACWGSPGLPELTPPAGTFQKVAAGNQGVCALRSDGQVLCWGRDPRITTGVPTGSFADISVGGGGCATDSQGAVTCWGIPNPTAPGGPGPVHGVVVGYCWACGPTERPSAGTTPSTRAAAPPARAPWGCRSTSSSPPAAAGSAREARSPAGSPAPSPRSSRRRRGPSARPRSWPGPTSTARARATCARMAYPWASPGAVPHRPVPSPSWRARAPWGRCRRRPCPARWEPAQTGGPSPAGTPGPACPPVPTTA